MGIGTLYARARPYGARARGDGVRPGGLGARQGAGGRHPQPRARRAHGPRRRVKNHPPEALKKAPFLGPFLILIL